MTKEPKSLLAPCLRIKLICSFSSINSTVGELLYERPRMLMCCAICGVDRKAVRDSVVSLLLAGRDTVRFHEAVTLHANLPHPQTASLLTFATYCLAVHPGVTL